jgi:hypothetical protein
LMDGSGIRLPLGDGSNYGLDPRYREWNLDYGRTNAGNYKLTLRGDGVCIAELELRDLPAVRQKPFRIGPNAF